MELALDIMVISLTVVSVVMLVVGFLVWLKIVWEFLFEDECKRYNHAGSSYRAKFWEQKIKKALEEMDKEKSDE